MMLNSLLIGLRGQAAMQAEIIALRHQLTVFQRTQKPKRIMLNGRLARSARTSSPFVPIPSPSFPRQDSGHTRFDQRIPPRLLRFLWPRADKCTAPFASLWILGEWRTASGLGKDVLGPGAPASKVIPAI